LGKSQKNLLYEILALQDGEEARNYVIQVMMTENRIRGRPEEERLVEAKTCACFSLFLLLSFGKRFINKTPQF